MLRGSLELYDEFLILRLSPNLVHIEAVRAPPPTFPEDGIPERVDFSQIKTITVKPIKSLLSKNVELEMLLNSGDSWTIAAKSHIYEAILSAYRRWEKPTRP